MKFTKITKRYPGDVVIAYRDSGKTKKALESMLGSPIETGQWFKFGQGTVLQITDDGVNTIKPLQNFFRTKFKSLIKTEAILSTHSLDDLYPFRVSYQWKNSIEDLNRNMLVFETKRSAEFIDVIERHFTLSETEVIEVLVEGEDFISSVWVTPMGIAYDIYDIDSWTLDYIMTALFAWLYQTLKKNDTEHIRHGFVQV